MATRKLEIVITGDAKSGAQALDQIGESSTTLEGKISGLSSTFGTIAKTAGGFLLAGAIQQGPGALLSLSKQAANLELQMAKTDTVFGDNAESVRAWADANAHAMGLTRTEAASLATGLGDLLKPMGFTAEQAAAMSTKTIGLAGALAEWSGGQVSATQAAEVLQKAYLGETDGLKALGIAISAADVEARLAAKGQDKLTGAARDQARALAIQELIFEKSTDAQEAFANGSDSAARKQAEMSAQMKEAKEQLALALAPAIASVTTLLATLAVPAFQALGEAIGLVAQGASIFAPAFEKIPAIFEALEPFLAPILGALGSIAAVILGSMVPAVIAWTAAEIAKTAALIASAAAFIAANAPLIAIAAGVAALVAGIILLVQHWDAITAKVPFLKTALEGVTDFVTDTVIPMFQSISDAAQAVIDWVSDNWETIATVLAGPFAPLVLLATDAFGVRSALEDAFDAVKQWVRDNWPIIATLISGPFAPIVFLATDAFGVRTSLQNGMDALKQYVSDRVGDIVAFFTGLPARLRQLLADITSAAGAIGNAIRDGLIGGIEGTIGVIGDLGDKLLEALKSLINSAIDSINDAIPNKIGFSVAGKDIGIDLPDNPIPHIARGGIVVAGDNPSGIEAIVPLERAGEFGFGGGPTFNITINAVDGESVRRIIPELVRQIDLHLRRAGRARIA